MEKNQSNKPLTNKKDITSLNIKSWLRESILGYSFWCLFQGMAPMIWFYPLNELEISGYEAFAVCLFSPVVLAFGSFFRQRCILAILRIGGIVGLASFQCPSTLSRLMVLCLGLSCLLIVFASTITSKNIIKRHTSGWGLMLGLCLFISSRVWFISFVPTWWNDNWNSITIAFVSIATIDKILSGDDIEEDNGVNKSVPTRNCLIMGMALGTSLFQTQLIVGETSILSRWTVRGYPDTGPQPVPNGMLVLISIFIALSMAWKGVFRRSVFCYFIYSISFFTLYFIPSYIGYAAGLLVAFYTILIWPEVVDDLFTTRTASTFIVCGLVYLVEILFSVWTVAYNFVPGGIYTRERTDLLIAFMICTLGLFTFTGKYCIKENNESPTMLLTKTRNVNNRPSFIIFTILSIFLLFGIAGMIYRLPKQNFQHGDIKHPKADFTAAIFTYHFGYDNKGWPSLERTKALFEEIDADVITLLESDASKTFLGNNDLGSWLAENLQMYVDFGPSTKDHTWGNLILSKYPIVKSTHHLLPSPEGELAPAISATVNMSGNYVDFVVTHMGNDRDVLDRKLQADFLAKEMINAKNPLVFLGYVTSAPQSREYNVLLQTAGLRDIDDTDMDRWCEYIFYKNLIKLAYARISHAGLSDTEIQVGKFRLPQSENYQDRLKIVTDPKKIDEPNILFSSKFGKFSKGHNWINSHRYHMSTPKYFVE